MVAAITVIMALVPALSLVSPSASASGAFTDPSHISSTLLGCRSPVQKLSTTNYICGDTEYTSGNLQKSWNEGDLVPHRLVLTSAQNSNLDYTVVVAADNKDNGTYGYDFMGPVTLNSGNWTAKLSYGGAVGTSRSDSSCTVSNPTGLLFTDTDPYSGGGFGGTDVTMYRILNIHQALGTTCTLDWVERLAISTDTVKGASQFDGSSLHTNAALMTDSGPTTQGIGAADVSIPVNTVLPQTLRKESSAQQGVGNLWTVEKSATGTANSLTNTCDPTKRSEAVTVTVTPTDTPTTGDITVSSQVYATNPSQRDLIVDVTDVVHGSVSGTDTTHTHTATTVTLPANSVDFPLFGHFDGSNNWVGDPQTDTYPSGTTNLYDLASATYTDAVFTTITIGTKTARYPTSGYLTVHPSTATDPTATLSDVETITGTGLSFTLDSTALNPAPAGTYTYTDGSGTHTYTPGSGVKVTNLSWTGSSGGAVSGTDVIFHKTIYADAGTALTTSDNAQLADTATVTADESGDYDTFSTHVDVTAGTAALIEVDKTISQAVTTAQSFTFDIKSGTTTLEQIPVTIAASDPSATPPVIHTSGSGTSTNYYTPGSYTVHEETPTGSSAGWSLPTDGTTTITSGQCLVQQSMANNLAPARAKVQKLTDPTGSGQEAGWVFTLKGGSLPTSGVTVTTTDTTTSTPGSDDMTFLTPSNSPDLDAGTYTITETAQDHWTNTKIEQSTTGGEAPSARATVASCSFTIVYPRDHDAVFECFFTNVEKAHLQLHKTQGSSTGPAMPGISFQLRTGASESAQGTLVGSGTTDASGNIDFGWLDAGTTASPQVYQLCEMGVKTAWAVSFSNGGTTFTPFIAVDSTTDNSTVCVNVTLHPGDDITIGVVDTPPPGGDARTIGYWKNWSGSYTGGKQADALGDALSKGAIVMATSGGTPTFSVTAATEQTAVYILDKRDASGAHKKMASDPAYNMAAQLLAAQLNYAAGAYVCGNITSAITQAQALLGKYGYNATGSYASAMTAADKATANTLAGLFDSYNNNTLTVCT